MAVPGETTQLLKQLAEAAAGLPGPGYAVALDAAIQLREKAPDEPVGLFGDVRPGQDGINRLEAIYKQLDIIERRCLPAGGRFSDNQWQMINDFIAGALPKIVTVPEYVLNRQVYLDYLGITEDKRFNVALMPRQGGKTTCIAAVITAIILECPDISIGIFASKLEQASIMQSKVVDNVRTLGHKITTISSENLVIFQHSSTRYASIKAYSMNTVVRFYFIAHGTPLYICIHMYITMYPCRCFRRALPRAAQCDEAPVGCLHRDVPRDASPSASAPSPCELCSGRCCFRPPFPRPLAKVAPQCLHPLLPFQGL
jgi:hypothetical protein